MKEKNKKFVYLIGLLIRKLEMQCDGPRLERLIDLHGKGVFFTGPKDIGEEEIYKYVCEIIGYEVSGTDIIVEADNPMEAIDIFLDQWQGAKVGKDSPALWIKKSVAFDQYPYCDRLRNTNGDYRCNCAEEGLSDCFFYNGEAPYDCPFEDEEKDCQVESTFEYKGVQYKMISHFS